MSFHFEVSLLSFVLGEDGSELTCQFFWQFFHLYQRACADKMTLDAPRGIFCAADEIFCASFPIII